MACHKRPAGLVPEGLLLEMVTSEGTATEIVARSMEARGWCPQSGTASGKVHSRYVRRPKDFPLGGRIVRLIIHARRFGRRGRVDL